MKRNKILIVDDMEINRAILCELFHSDYDVLEAENGLAALNLLHQHQDSIAIILLDIVMPVMDGFQVMEHLQSEGIMKKIPVILITADTYQENEIKALNLGASDIILKPFNSHIVKKRVENSIELYRHKNHLEDLVEHQTKKLTETNDFIIDALSTVIEYRSLESGQHIRRIRVLTKTLASCVQRMFPEYKLTSRLIDTIASASAMHDIGKIAIPDSILLKPGRLTPDEFEVMKTHTSKGCEILQTFQRMDDKVYLHYCYDICRFHHERWDGRGYPDGLKGDEIPVCAQIVSIADVYDALTSDRVYKPAYSHEEAVQMILHGECGTFSEQMISCFQQVSDIFKEISATYKDGAIEDNITATFLPDQTELSPPSVKDPSDIARELQEASTALQKETLERDALINAIPGGVAKVAVDDEFRILLASEGFYKLTGYTRNEYHAAPIEGKGIRLILEEDIPELTQSINQQMKEGSPISVQYRIRKKDGGIAWIDVHGSAVEIEDGIAIVQAVFIDQTLSKKTENMLLMNEERYRIIVEQAQDIIFEWDMMNSTMYHSPAFEKKFKYDLPIHNFWETICTTDIVHEEDKKPFLDFKELLRSGQSHAELEIRIKMNTGEYIWCRIKANVIFDQNQHPIRTIATISDVDDYKKENALLENMAQKDLLTGIYNKLTTEKIIQDYLSADGKDKCHALFIIDIDNFKTVNDTFGHTVGDTVLQMISSCLKTHFRTEDIIGRAGGDEFVVFLKNVPSDALIYEKAELLRDALQNFSLSAKEAFPISISIGISLYPQNGCKYAELFTTADKALYRSKRDGKNRYTFYNQEIC